MDIFEELRSLIMALNDANVPYALCGGFAMAVHGRARATEDIDLLLPEEELPRLRGVIEQLGFGFEDSPMALANGKVRITRFVKLEPSSQDYLCLDVLLVTPETRAAWSNRKTTHSSFGTVSVVSRFDLADLKRLRNSAVDQEDIAHLES